MKLSPHVFLLQTVTLLYNELFETSHDYRNAMSLGTPGNNKTVYIPLRFWFNRNPGLALLIVQRMAPNAVDLKAAVVGYVVVTAVGTAPFMQWRKANASQAQITGDV